MHTAHTQLPAVENITAHMTEPRSFSIKYFSLFLINYPPFQAVRILTLNPANIFFLQEPTFQNCVVGLTSRQATKFRL